MLQCAETWFSKGSFRTSVGKRKGLEGCIWQNVYTAPVPAKISICCRITLHDYFGCRDFFFFFCMHKCVCADVLLEMYSLHLLLKNEVSIMTRCLSIPCSEFQGRFFPA